MVNFEQEILAYLSLPSIPKKEWDKESAFDKGVAVVELQTGSEGYAVATFNPEKGDTKPRVTKVFGSEPFGDIRCVYVVPDYMETNMENADLDDASKAKAEEIINEGNEIANNETETVTSPNPENEYSFDFIHNDEEAIAYIEAYNKKNKISGRVPQKHDAIVMRLAVIYADENKPIEE